MNEIRYYAVPDPSKPGQMTYWRYSRGALRPWPSNARYGPELSRDDVPPELLGAERAAWIHRWHRRNIQEWRMLIGFEIWRDPHGCRARFALHTGRCGLCAGRLADQESKVYGVGPECRQGFPPVTLAALAGQMFYVYAEHEAQQCAAR